VFVVREGNPLGIDSWDDLAKPGVEIVTPNPGSSGAARWNILSAWAHVVGAGGTDKEAEQFVADLLANTPALPASGREATSAFVEGDQDVLLSYENEAITAQRADVDLDYVIPDETILIENPAAVTKEAKSPEKAKAFLDFLKTPEAQKIYASKGYRPAKQPAWDAKQFPTPKQLFTIDDLGGWSKVNTEFFDPTNGSVAKIEQDLGVSTAK